MPASIHLNADLGEGFGVYPAPMQVWRAQLDRGGELVPATAELPSPQRIMESVSAVNLACGFHAGDPLLIKESVALAAETGCGVGAHPSFPDRAGFGNRYMELSPGDLKAMLQYQFGVLEGFLRIYRLPLSHVKCHGALYNRSMSDETLARTVAEAVAEYDPAIPLYGLPDSALQTAAEWLGVPFVREGFADRAYHQNGQLVDRRRDDAMVLDPEAVAQRVTDMAREGTVTTIDGPVIKIDPQTVCFHPDTPGMMAMLESTRQHLTEAGITVSRASDRA